jgi:[ribosomal protein S5]-alanine N-acetyltransferase
VTIETERLILRPFTMRDAPVIQRLLNDPHVSDGLLSVGYPFELPDAEKWLAGRITNRFAITLKGSGKLCGGIGIHTNAKHPRGEMGYWVGRAYWGKGFATESAQALVKYGFEKLNLHRIAAMHFPRNDASRRVLEKIGMKREGLLRQYARKDGRFEDLIVYSVLRGEAEPLPHGRGSVSNVVLRTEPRA